MLGKNIDEPGAYWQTMGYGTTPWPACGEVDIMEHWGSNQNYIQSAIHTPQVTEGQSIMEVNIYLLLQVISMFTLLNGLNKKCILA